MKTRLLSIALSAALSMGLAPLSAQAQELSESQAERVGQFVSQEAIAVTAGARANNGIMLLDGSDSAELEGDGTAEHPYTVESASELRQALVQGGHIKLSKDITLPTEGGSVFLVVPENAVAELDLSGHRISSSESSGQVITNKGTLTIIDTGQEKGAISGGSITLVNFDTMVLDGVTVINTTNIGVYNLHDLTTDGCSLHGVTPLYLSGLNGTTESGTNVISNILNTTVSPAESASGEDGFWGIVVLGKGLAEDGSYDNSTVVVNVMGCRIESSIGGQGIATNASSGTYAGFTLNVQNTTVDLNADDPQGCGLYLPGIGDTTITNSTIAAGQGIRIAAGDLTIGRNTTVSSAVAMGDEDLVAGGSGGTLGALVVGKAGGGYLGDVNIAVDSTASVINSSESSGADGQVAAAIIVSDKNMGSTAYSGNTINVVVNGRILGDVVKTSTIDTSSVATTQDGGSVLLKLDGTTVDGNIINQSATGVDIVGTTVTGNVTTTSQQASVGIVGSTIEGTVTNTNQSNASAITIANSSIGSLSEEQKAGITIVNSTVGDNPQGTESENVALIGSTPYSSVEEAIKAAQSGQTVYLLNNATAAAQLSIPAGVTLDGQRFSLSYSGESGIEQGGFINNTNNNVDIRNLVINTDGKAKHGIQFYNCTGGRVSGCTVNGGYYTSVIVNGSEVDIEDCILNPGSGAYANIEYAMGENVTNVPKLSLGNIEYSDGAPLVYLDKATLDRVAQNAFPSVDNPDPSTVVNVINEFIDGADVVWSETTGGATTVEPQDPTPSIPGGGGGTTAPSYDITVAQPVDGTIAVEPTSAKEGDEVTVTVTPDEGFELSELTVTDEDGNELELTANADGTYSFEMPAGKVNVSATFACDGGALCPSHEFTDVDQDQWYHAAIDWAVTEGVMHGIGGTTLFDPDGDLTREQAATVMWNGWAQGDLAAPAVALTDVDQSQWYAPYVNWAVEAAVMQGYGGTDRFGVGDALTREQFAMVIANATEANLSGADTSVLEDFNDPESVSDWATPVMAWAVESGVINGVALNDGTFDLQGSREVTRAEMAMMVMNAVEEGILEL